MTLTQILPDFLVLAPAQRLSTLFRPESMRSFLTATLIVFLAAPSGFGKVIVFWQDGFPTIASVPISRQTLVKSLEGMDAVFVLWLANIRSNLWEIQS
jgi:hypothetical protein